MDEARMEQPLGDPPIIGHDDETLRRLVEPSDWEDAFFGKDVSDGALSAHRRMGNDAARLVISEVAIRSRSTAVPHLDNVFGCHLGAKFGWSSVDVHLTRNNERIRRLARRDTTECEIPVNPKREWNGFF